MVGVRGMGKNVTSDAMEVSGFGNNTRRALRDIKNIMGAVPVLRAVAKRGLPEKQPCDQHSGKKPPDIGQLPGDMLQLLRRDKLELRNRFLNQMELLLRLAPSSACRDFDFDLGASPLAAALLHADQLFSNDLLLPLHLLSSPPPLHKAGTSSIAVVHMVLGRPKKVLVVGSLMRGSKKAWKKYFGLCRYGGGGPGRRPATGKVFPKTVSCPESLSTSPRMSNASATVGLWFGEGVLDSNEESSIYEAALQTRSQI